MDGLRQLTAADDLEALTSLIHRAYAPLAARGLHYWGTHQSVADTAERCGRGETWVVDGPDGIVATLTLERSARGTPVYERPEVAKFSQFCVDPQHKGTGLGSRLMDHAEARAADLGATVLACDTSEHAEGLIGMYQRRGFRLAGHADWRPKVNYRSVLLTLAVGWSERPATHDDLPALHALRRDAYRQYVVQRFGPWDDDWQREHFAQRFTQRPAHVLSWRGREVGYWDGQWPEGGFTLGNLVLSRDHWGSGLGSAVLAQLLRRADADARTTRLQVFPENPAVRLYQRFGFHVERTSEHHLHLVRPPR